MNRFNRLINPADFQDPQFVQYIQEASGRRTFPQQRKFWEWGKGFQALKELDYLKRDKRAIGLGTGYEPFAFVLSRSIEHVIRTDYIDQTNPFMRTYGEKIQIKKGERPNFVPATLGYEEDRIGFLNLDATDMRAVADASLDIVYSFSSIEHFGNRRDRPPHGAIKCMQESQRILRRGGICMGATEYQLNPGLHPEFFRQEDFVKEICQSHTMRPIEPFDFELPEAMYDSKYYYPTALKEAFQEKCKMHEHLGVVSGNRVVVSIFFVFIKE
jgi:SAM-dependent methyltransferase